MEKINALLEACKNLIDWPNWFWNYEKGKCQFCGSKSKILSEHVKGCPAREIHQSFRALKGQENG